ncbi:MAG: hypothetical protein AB1547_10050 [Thermodesulfobacteriota bacterium]
MSSLFRENKTLFIIIAVGIFLIELEIFAIAAMKSGRTAKLEIRDARGNIVHVTDGNDLSSFNKYYFEKTFGPLEQYQVNLVTREEPFPFRAWFTAAIGIPIGAVLLFAFIAKAVGVLFFGHSADAHPANASKASDLPLAEASRIEKIAASFGRLNIFAIGFIILTGVLAYWILPNFILYLGELGIETILRFKWFFLTLGLVVLGIFLWIIYLRYLLAKKHLDTQMEIEKFRLQLAATHGKPLELAAPAASSATIDYQGTDDSN